MVVITILLSFFHPKMDVRTVPKDTLHYLVLMNLYEKDFNYGNREVHSSTLANEIKDVERQLRRRLSNRFIVVPVDSCLKSVPWEHFTRRDIVYLDGRDTSKIQEACDRCHILKNLLVIDASWIYLSEPAFQKLERKIENRRPDGLGSYYHITGTWWKIHTLVYDPRREKVIYYRKNEYSQWDNVKPMKRLPGFGHRRFFNWSLTTTKDWLTHRKRIRVRKQAFFL